MPVPSQEESPVSVTKTLKPEPFADVVWSLDQALIWGHTRRSDLANRASVVVPAPQRLTWAEYPLSFEEEDERPETVLSRQFTGSELLQAIRLGEVRTLVDGQPVDPVTYHTAALAPHSTGTALTWTDTAPFETHQHSDGTLYQKRHKRRLEPSLVIEDVLRLFPGPVTERPSKPVPGRPSLENPVPKEVEEHLKPDADLPDNHGDGSAPSPKLSSRRRSPPEHLAGELPLIESLRSISNCINEALLRGVNVPSSSPKRVEFIIAKIPDIERRFGKRDSLQNLFLGRHSRANRLAEAGYADLGFLSKLGIEVGKPKTCKS